MGLENYKIIESDIREYGLDLRNDDELNNDSNIDFIIKMAYERIKTRIYELNHDIQEDADIEALLTTTTRINGFKKAQVMCVINYTNMNDSVDDPIDQNIDAILRHECKLSKMNGWQK